MQTIDRPITTLFMLMSVDGKISTGSDDSLDFDRDLPTIPGVREGLHQYYEIEQTTDLWSLNSGRVQAKIGVNEKPFSGKGPVSFVVIDNHHLTEHGVRYFARKSKNFVLVTTNPAHPAFAVCDENLNIMYQKVLNLEAMLSELKGKYGCKRITIQTGGTLNNLFLRHHLLDYVDIVVAPVLVGGKEVPTLIDGPSVTCCNTRMDIGVLRLETAEVLQNSYVRLRYQVIS